MSKTNIAIPFNEEKLSVLEFALKKENTTTQEKMEKALEALYERVVPEPLREYVESRITPAAKPKRPAKPAVPIPAPLPDIRYTAPEGMAASRLALSRLAPPPLPFLPARLRRSHSVTA